MDSKCTTILSKSWPHHFFKVDLLIPLGIFSLVLIFYISIDSRGTQLQVYGTSARQICKKHNETEWKRIHRRMTSTATKKRLETCDKYIRKIRHLIYPDDINLFDPNYIYYNKNGSDVATKLAFGIISHHQSTILEILLHLIFRPYNAYCIYVPSNAKKEYKELFTKLIDCYKHLYPDSLIFMAKDTEPIEWGLFNLLHADLKCMDQLMAYSNHTWKYFINLAGTELPLISVDELAKRLTRNPVKHSLQSYYQKKWDKRFKFTYSHRKVHGQVKFTRTGRRKDGPPYKLKIYKGYKNVILRRDFVNFLLNHQVALDFQEFVKDMMIPDEHFYSTLSRIKKIRFQKLSTGEKEYRVKQNRSNKKIDYAPQLCQRVSLWFREDCHGENIRGICHLALEDLDELDKKVYNPQTGMHDCFVANKFDSNIDVSSIICMAKRIHMQEMQDIEIGK